MEAGVAVERFGRFEVVSILGRGAQGTVYLAEDTRLGRPVAVKTLRVDRLDAAERAAQTETMLGEARIVGRLSHPNIVPLYDAGEDNERPYLVFEFVQGKTLADLIRERGTVAPLEAVRITLGLLAGIDCAHAAGVVHRDLKPANIMIAAGDVPRIMDFGIASRTAGDKAAAEGLSGTPSYMAPEYLAGQPFTARCDLFAVGMILYEMLTGAPAIKRDNHFQTMFAMAEEAFTRPSQVNDAVDEKLETIVMRALEKDPAGRHADATEITDALNAWANPQAAPIDAAGGEAGGTLEFLLRRMRYKSDFPVLSSTISSVNRMGSSENEPNGALADSILKDVSLTNKLLRMVNTAYYQQFGGAVSTVSRAVSILGFQKVRSAALSLMLFEHLQNKAQAADLKDLITANYFSGVLSRELAAKLGIGNGEEGFICAMFHRLGRMLAVFYLHDESAEIGRIAKTRNIDEDLAALEVIGLSYTDLGLGVAKHWNLPEHITRSMQCVVGPVPGPGAPDDARLCALAELSNRMADMVLLPAGRAREAALRKIDADYAIPLGLDAGQIDDMLGSAARAFIAESESLGLPLGSGRFVKQVCELSAAAQSEGGAEGGVAAGSALPAAAAAGAAETMLNADGSAQAAPARVAVPPPRSEMLSAGIQDITHALASPYQLNDVLRIILETMYRAIGFTRVILCTLDPRSGSLRARLGFGADAEAIIKRGFAVPLAASKDVFYGAISKAADLCIEDRDSQKIRAYVPEWYRKAIDAHGFVLFPVVINKKAVALIYADGDEPSKMRFAEGELNLLKALRNQAILAIRQKSGG